MAVLDSSRLVYVLGEMVDLRKHAEHVMTLSEVSPKTPIHILIDSPGGSVFGSMSLLQAVERVKTRGTKVICTVQGMAMSMAMHLMAACSENYILPTSLLMYHPVSVSYFQVRLTEDSSRELHTQLKIIGDYLDTKLRKRLGVSEKLFTEYWRGEYVQFGHDFIDHAPNFAKLVHDIRIK